ncbi:MAG: aspartate aminotransferase family protein [Microbacteriaceae bacterium]
MLKAESADILARLTALRCADAPTHGGRVLSYVYDSGIPELDELAAAAMRAVQPVNGLDPTTFTSVAVLESETVAFARELVNGPSPAEGAAGVVGSVTSGGTESCLLAVKTARDVWRAAGGVGQPRLLAPVTVHAAFHKAAEYFGLTLDLVDVDHATGALRASDLVARLSEDVALVVVSAPSYPYAGLDPVEPVAAACQGAGIACHVDACVGGWILPFWPASDNGQAEESRWDFRVPGVTSMSLDVHKFGYVPKGVSVLLQRGRDRQRHQFFATTRWPGYPVVNPTMLGSKSVGALAAAWAVIQWLGRDGYRELAASCARSTHALIALVDGLAGLRVVGTPTGPLFAVATDETAPEAVRVDPHHWVDRLQTYGWRLQLQPGFTQTDGTHLPHTAHLTITPVTEKILPELSAAMVTAADEVRGIPADSAVSLGGVGARDVPTSEAAFTVLSRIGLAPDGPGDTLPDEMAPFLSLIESLPHSLTERLLIELLARIVEPPTK